MLSPGRDEDPSHADLLRRVPFCFRPIIVGHELSDDTAHGAEQVGASAVHAPGCGTTAHPSVRAARGEYIELKNGTVSFDPGDLCPLPGRSCQRCTRPRRATGGTTLRRASPRLPRPATGTRSRVSVRFNTSRRRPGLRQSAPVPAPMGVVIANAPVPGQVDTSWPTMVDASAPHTTFATVWRGTNVALGEAR